MNPSKVSSIIRHIISCTLVGGHGSSKQASCRPFDPPKSWYRPLHCLQPNRPLPHSRHLHRPQPHRHRPHSSLPHKTRLPALLVLAAIPQLQTALILRKLLIQPASQSPISVSVAARTSIARTWKMLNARTPSGISHSATLGKFPLLLLLSCVDQPMLVQTWYARPTEDSLSEQTHKSSLS